MMEAQLKSMMNDQLTKVRRAIKTVSGVGIGKVEEGRNFSLENFWLHFSIAIQTVSNNMTRLALALTKPPLPEASEVGDLLRSVETAYTTLLVLYRTLPEDQGAVLYSAVTTAAVDIFNKLEQYFTVCANDPKDMAQAELMGVLWRACESVYSLPSNNKDAVVQSMDNEDQLIKDAVEELENELKLQRTMRKSGVVSVETDKWSDVEYRLVEGTLALVRTVRAVAKRVLHMIKKNADKENKRHIVQLDLVSQIISTVSPALDDFISSVYPPIEVQPLPQQLEAILSSVRKLINDVSQFDFAERACSGKPYWATHFLKDLGDNENTLQTLISCEEILELANLTMD